MYARAPIAAATHSASARDEVADVWVWAEVGFAAYEDGRDYGAADGTGLFHPLRGGLGRIYFHGDVFQRIMGVDRVSEQHAISSRKVAGCPVDT